LSATSDLRDVLRRQSVGSQAELTVEATMASMAIRAVRSDPEVHLGILPLRAVERMLDRIDQLAQYRKDGQLGDLVSKEQVAKDSLDLVQVMARAARQDDDTQDAGVPAFPVLDSLIDYRQSVEIDSASDQINVVDKDGAADLAEALEKLGNEMLATAVAEDRLRTSHYAVI
jgi:hypothetical protein